MFYKLLWWLQFYNNNFLILGLHFIPLRTPGGDPVSHIGIFVKIKLSLEQTVSSGLCPQNLEASKQKFSLPNPFNTRLTDTIENSEWNYSQKTDVTNSNSNIIGDGVHVVSHTSPPKLVRQQAVVTADVHCDSSQNSYWLQLTI